MSSKIVKALLFLYHGIFYSQTRVCRFEPTCSKYLEDAIKKYGVSKGSTLALKRILACHPFSNKPFFDPA